MRVFGRELGVVCCWVVCWAVDLGWWLRWLRRLRRLLHRPMMGLDLYSSEMFQDFVVVF